MRRRGSAGEEPHSRAFETPEDTKRRQQEGRGTRRRREGEGEGRMQAEENSERIEEEKE